jgi:nucleoside-diphosphate-sugar epimerase
MDVLIIGYGLIGSELTRELKKKSHNVTILDPFLKGDEIHENSFSFLKLNFQDFFKQNKRKFDAIINTAYPSKRDKYNPLDNVEEISNSILVNSELIFSLFENSTKILKKNGVLIQCASIYGFFTPRFEIYEGNDRITPPDYIFIKAGLIATTKYYAKKYFGLFRVNTISFGGVFNNHENSFVENYGKHTYSKQMMNSAQVVKGILYLISDDNGVTGSNLIVDDGFTL